jgi:hypothetical protein
MQEMLADGYKVKLDGIGTLYPTLTSEGVDNAKDYNYSPRQKEMWGINAKSIHNDIPKSAEPPNFSRRRAISSIALS